MLNLNEGIPFLHDINSSVRTLLCGYCETTKVLTNRRSTQVQT
jgi:hypothetical protein